MPWWETDTFADDIAIPDPMHQMAGPNGLAVVKVFDDGRTSKGWSQKEFMQNYLKHKFNMQIALVGWITGRWNFAFLMRSLKMVCIDIDGKNGGFDNIGKLGMLPPTLAETSKSGDGFHLFYATPWDVWDDDLGFAMFKDRIGAVQGVDVRSVGCVYHYPGQKWNTRPVADLPNYLKQRWEADQAAGDKQVQEIIALLDAGDDAELMVAQDSLLKDLDKPIPAGRRNNTLYAIGVKMMVLNIPHWDGLLYQRGLKVGLDQQEMGKLIDNIKKYQ
jgi:hypothetical protein